MFRLALLVIALFLGTVTLPCRAAPVAAATPAPLHCSYHGDPHLIPFLQPYTQYWCQHPGWELLLSNQYVTLYVLVSSSPYIILDYMLIFPGPSSCSNVATSASPIPCASGGPVLSFPSGLSYIHIYLTQPLVIEITNWGSYINIDIWESPALVNQSCGVCVKWDCPLESPWVNPITLITQICLAVIGAAQKNTIATINQKVLTVAQTSCVNDVQTTFQTRSALGAIDLVVQDGIETLLITNSTSSLFAGVAARKQNAVSQATTAVNALLSNSSTVCNSQKQCLTPLSTT